MAISIRFLLKGTILTMSAAIIVQVLRFITNIILARLLAPELFGVMLLVNSFRSGVELISDIGIGQNVIYHRDANDPEFYNTAWTLQVIRSWGIWLVALVLTVPFAHFYQSHALLYIVPLTSFNIVLIGFSSLATALVLKRLQVAKHNIYDVITAFISAVGLVVFAYFSRTIWSLVFGGLFGSAVYMIGSYFLLPDVRQRFYLSKRFALEIINFGKWIFISSILYFLSTNFDRLYLAKAIPLNLLGVYGIARSMSELLGLLMLRLGNYVLFPLISSNAQMPRLKLRNEFAPIRIRFLIVAGVGFSLVAATADFLIRVFYDNRYQAAAWMLPVLIIGSWFSILAYVNESNLLGLGRPAYSAVANSSKLVFLLIGLPLGVTSWGIFGGILIVAFSDLFRYFPLLVGQIKERLSFAFQDIVLTLMVCGLIAFWEWVRWHFGWGTSFDTIAPELSAMFPHLHEAQ